MPVLFSVMRVSDDGLRLYLFKRVRDLVVMLRQHMHNYLGDIMMLVHEHWAADKPLLPIILELFSEVAGESLFCAAERGGGGGFQLASRHPCPIPSGNLSSSIAWWIGSLSGTVPHCA
jgi:hypothetical protein